MAAAAQYKQNMNILRAHPDESIKPNHFYQKKKKKVTQRKTAKVRQEMAAAIQLSESETD